MEHKLKSFSFTTSTFPSLNVSSLFQFKVSIIPRLKRFLHCSGEREVAGLTSRYTNSVIDLREFDRLLIK